MMTHTRRMSYVKRPCQHTKVYSGETLPLVERWFWICTDCKDTGSDKLAERPVTDPESYWRTMRQLQPSCWVPALYRNVVG